MEHKDKVEAISKITRLYSLIPKMESDIAIDNLNFSVWVAAFATAGFGLTLLKAEFIVQNSWLSELIANVVILYIQIALILAVICAGVVRYYINLRLEKEREYLTYLYAQESVLLSGRDQEIAFDLVDVVREGKCLPENAQADFKEIDVKSRLYQKKYKQILMAELILVGTAYVALLIVGIRAFPNITGA